MTVRADLSSLQQDVKRMEQTFSGGFNNIKSSVLSVGKELATSLRFGLSIGAAVAFGHFNLLNAIRKWIVTLEPKFH